jgi:hypothetical protein
MNFINRNWRKLVFTLSILLLPAISLADTTNCDPAGGKICNPLGTTTSLPDLIQKVLEGLLKLGIPVVALAIIYCGFLFVFARGNSEKITKAREALMYTLVGAAILLGAWAIAKMISSTVTTLAS